MIDGHSNNNLSAVTYRKSRLLVSVSKRPCNRLNSVLPKFVFMGTSECDFGKKVTEDIIS